MSFSVNLVSWATSIACLLRDLIFGTVIYILHGLSWRFCTSSSLSDCIIFSSSNAWGFPLTAFILNKPRIYKPSYIVTLFNATDIFQ